MNTQRNHRKGRRETNSHKEKEKERSKEKHEIGRSIFNNSEKKVARDRPIWMDGSRVGKKL